MRLQLQYMVVVATSNTPLIIFDKKLICLPKSNVFDDTFRPHENLYRTGGPLTGNSQNTSTLVTYLFPNKKIPIRILVTNRVTNTVFAIGLSILLPRRHCFPQKD